MSFCVRLGSCFPYLTHYVSACLLVAHCALAHQYYMHHHELLFTRCNQHFSLWMDHRLLPGSHCKQIRMWPSLLFTLVVIGCLLSVHVVKNTWVMSVVWNVVSSSMLLGSRFSIRLDTCLLSAKQRKLCGSHTALIYTHLGLLITILSPLLVVLTSPVLTVQYQYNCALHHALVACSALFTSYSVAPSDMLYPLR